MDNNKHLIIKDKNGDIWEFFLTNEGNITYNMISQEGGYKEKNIIGTGALEYAADVDKSGVIRLIYINKKGEFKYCKYENGNWYIKTIQHFAEKNYLVKELGLSTADKEINIFYIRLKSESLGALYHNRLTDGKSLNYFVSDIVLHPDFKTSYQLDTENNRLIYVNVKEQTASFNHYEFLNNYANSSVLLFTLKVNSTDFFMLKHQGISYFLNVSKDNEEYSIDVVTIDKGGKISSNNLNKCYTNIYNPLLISYDTILWAFWMKEEKVYYSYFKEQWSEGEELDAEYKGNASMYYYISQKNSGEKKMQRIIGTDFPDIKFLIPPSIKKQKKEINDDGLYKDGIEKTTEKTGDYLTYIKNKYDLKTKPDKREEGIKELYRLSDRRKTNIEHEGVIPSIDIENEKYNDEELNHGQRVRFEAKCMELNSYNERLRTELESVKRKWEMNLNQYIEIERNLKEDNKTLLQNKNKLEQEVIQLRNELEEEKSKSILTRLLKK